MVPGVELLVGLHSPVGASTVMLQIPRRFDAANPCLIAAASSGSRGIYGALPTAGIWGLRHGCAVVHTDKGTGSGVFDVAGGRGLRIDGTLAVTAQSPNAISTPVCRRMRWIFSRSSSLLTAPSTSATSTCSPIAVHDRASLKLLEAMEVHGWLHRW